MFMIKDCERLVALQCETLHTRSVSLTLNGKGQCSHAYLHLGGDEEAADANELQSGLEHVALCGHEAVKVVLGQVI